MSAVTIKKDRPKSQDDEAARVYGMATAEEIAVERAVIGACMLEAGVFQEIASQLTVNDFYDINCREVWSAMEALNESGSPIDMLIVLDALKKRKSDVSAFTLAMFTNSVNQSGNAVYHAHIIKEMNLKRSLIAFSNQTVQDVADNIDVFEALDKAQSRIQKMTQGLFRGQVLKTADVVEEVFNKILHEREHTQSIPRGVKTGIYEFDRLMGYFKGGDFVLIAGRPGMGKTAFALNIAAYQCNRGASGVIFSLEMTRAQLIKRMIVSEAMVSNEAVKNPSSLSKEEMERLQDAKLALQDWKLLIDDNGNTTVGQVRAQAMRHKAEHGLDYIVIDYISLMNDPNYKGDRVNEISAISRGLKALAKDLDVPIIGLSQLSRQVEARPNKRPQMSDLRESGALEQDADVIIFPFRGEYYGFEEDEAGNSLIGKAELIVAKFRDGNPFETMVGWEGKYFKFTNI